MKEVALIYYMRSKDGAPLYHKKNLERIFGNSVSVKLYFTTELFENEFIYADAYLLSSEYLFPHIRNHISDYRTIIVMDRSFQKSGIFPIFKIPSGSDVLLVNDTPESSIHAIHMLYRLGFSNLNLIPYDSSLLDSGIYDEIEYATTPDEIKLVPLHIKNVIDCLARVISFKTLLALSDILNLKSDLIQRNMMQHLNITTEPDFNYSSYYINNYLIGLMLNHTVYDSDIAIIVVTADYKIVYANKKGAYIFNSKDLSPHQKKFIYILGNTDTDTIVDLYEKKYNFFKTSFTLMDDLVGYCFELQEINNMEERKKSFSVPQQNVKGLYAYYKFENIIHQSNALSKTINIAKKAASTDYTIHIRGESGTGKELFAQSIHNYSERKNGPFVAINCAALPESLLESELFGYEEGAFTGSIKGGKSGVFEQAQKGTIFLDEIGDISLKLQVRLLRVLQERQITRLGSEKVINVDVRIIAATNQDLEQLIKTGLFRSDLFHRINTIPLNIPPLRKRKEDILPLVENFMGNQYYSITSSEKNLLLDYSWPGNVRELENVINYYKVLGTFPDFIKNNNLSTNQFNENQKIDNNISNYFTSKEAEYIIKIKILKYLSQKSMAIHGLGREKILNRLKEEQIKISNAQLRNTLYSLKEEGLISISVGRAGCRITEQGISFLISAQEQN